MTHEADQPHGERQGIISILYGLGTVVEYLQTNGAPLPSSVFVQLTQGPNGTEGIHIDFISGELHQALRPSPNAQVAEFKSGGIRLKVFSEDLSKLGVTQAGQISIVEDMQTALGENLQR